MMGSALVAGRCVVIRFFKGRAREGKCPECTWLEIAGFRSKSKETLFNRRLKFHLTGGGWILLVIIFFPDLSAGFHTLLAAPKVEKSKPCRHVLRKGGFSEAFSNYPGASHTRRHSSSLLISNRHLLSPAVTRRHSSFFVTPRRSPSLVVTRRHSLSRAGGWTLCND